MVFIKFVILVLEVVFNTCRNIKLIYCYKLKGSLHLVELFEEWILGTLKLSLARESEALLIVHSFRQSFSFRLSMGISSWKLDEDGLIGKIQ